MIESISSQGFLFRVALLFTISLSDIDPSGIESNSCTFDSQITIFPREKYKRSVLVTK